MNSAHNCHELLQAFWASNNINFILWPIRHKSSKAIFTGVIFESLPMFRSKGLDIINGVSSKNYWCHTMIGHVGKPTWLHDLISHTQFRDAKMTVKLVFGYWLTKQRLRLKPNSIFGLNSEAEAECWGISNYNTEYYYNTTVFIQNKLRLELGRGQRAVEVGEWGSLLTQNLW